MSALNYSYEKIKISERRCAFATATYVSACAIRAIVCGTLLLFALSLTSVSCFSQQRSEIPSTIRLEKFDAPLNYVDLSKSGKKDDLAIVSETTNNSSVYAPTVYIFLAHDKHQAKKLSVVSIPPIYSNEFFLQFLQAE